MKITVSICNKFNIDIDQYYKNKFVVNKMRLTGKKRLKKQDNIYIFIKNWSTVNLNWYVVNMTIKRFKMDQELLLPIKKL